MARPEVSLVKDWTVDYESDLMRVEFGTAVFDDDYWRIVFKGGQVKYFYGETAWSDARRFAQDAESGEGW